MNKALSETLEKYKSINQKLKLNQYSTQPNIFQFKENEVDEFNNIWKLLRQSDLNTLTRTKSGAIQLGKKGANNYYAWDVKGSRLGVRLTVSIDGYIWVFKIGAFSKTDDKPEIYPSVAFKEFKLKCKENNISLEKYKITNGKEVKETIQSSMIKMYELDKEIENAHHIDFHSSYPAGLCNTHPEFRPVIEPIYKGREDPEKKDLNKAILNYSIGMMQSYKPENHRYAEWAHLAKDAIADNNKRILDMTLRLKINGNKILGYNTDGIWYTGPIYHGQGEGNELGQWSNDHINCKFRARSDGAYEFIENGVYNVKVRGLITYDMIQPDRTKWKWGDIYNGGSILYKINYDEGRIEKEDEVQA